MPDEFLPSYELRIRLSYGELGNTNNLVPFTTKNCKYWYSIPSTITTNLFYDRFDDRTLRALVLNHTLSSTISSQHNVFSIPGIVNLLRGRKTSFTNSTKTTKFELKYCKFCFATQIYEYGFSWFRLSWLNKKSVCDIHHIQLEEIACQNCKQSLEGLNALITALNGTCYKCSANLYDECLHLNHGYSPTLSNINYSTPIAKCFIFEIERLFKTLQKRASKKMKKHKELDYLTLWERKAFLFNFFQSKNMSLSLDAYDQILRLMFSNNTNDLLNTFSQLWTKRDIIFSSVTFTQEAIVGINSNCNTCEFKRGCLY